MAESALDIESIQGRPMEDHESVATEPTPDVHNTVTAMGARKSGDSYMALAGLEEKPSRVEVIAWCLYDLCSYFIYTVLIPIVFPLIISQIMSSLPEDTRGWFENGRGLLCSRKEMALYEGLTGRSIKVNNTKLSPLEWTSISWAIGLIFAGPLLGSICIRLDYGHTQRIIPVAAITIGALFCLPAGFFKTMWIFPPYVAAIVAASTVAATSHTRLLGLMIHGFLGPTIPRSQFQSRRGVASWLSLYATAVGCLGSAMISAFTYHMLREAEEFISLWVVSIFSGLIWLVGIFHALFNKQGANNPPSLSSVKATEHFLSMFRYPHAVGSLTGVFLSSFSTMCIFTGGVLYLVGQLCLGTSYLLYLWLIYFLFPLFSLPLLQPLQQVIKADAVKMQILGFLVSMVTSGTGFYYRNENWQRKHVLFFAAPQSMSVGLLYAFGRVLLLDCSPHGKEGAFSAWFSWVRALGTCIGFAVASAIPGNVSRSFGVAFCTSGLGMLILIFSNIGNLEGAVAAGNVRGDRERGSPVRDLDTCIETKEYMYEETLDEGNIKA